MTKVGPLLFIQQVRNEVSKVTWPSRNETTLTSIIVIIFAIIASIFFFLSDQVMSFFIKLILGLGS
ncbi:MAG: preprotein translocase subunit SecE [Alphaproteobacteria bacterium]